MTGIHLILPLGFFVLLTTFDAAWANNRKPRCDLLVSALKLEQAIAALAQSNSSENEGRLSEITKDFNQLNPLVEESFDEHSPVGQAVIRVQKQSQAVLSLTSSGFPDQAAATLKSAQYDRSLRSLKDIWARQGCSESEDVMRSDKNSSPLPSEDMLSSSPPDADGSTRKMTAELLRRMESVEATSGSIKALLVLVVILVICFAMLSKLVIVSTIGPRSWRENISSSSSHRYPRFSCDLPCLIKIGKDTVLETRCNSISRDCVSIVCSEQTTCGDVAVLYMAGFTLPCEAIWSGQKTSGFRFSTDLDEDILFSILAEDESGSSVSSKLDNAVRD